MTFKPYEFVPNPDSLHCTQAAFIMAYEGDRRPSSHDVPGGGA